MKKEYNKKCVWGFVFGIIGMMFYWILAIAPIIAIILSQMGRTSFDFENQKGRALGTAGLWLGIIYTCFYFLKLMM